VELTSAQRREQVIEAAIHEFAEYGYHAAKTAAIAKRAGISQPYVYALFDDKKALFIACQQRVREQIMDAFKSAWRPAGTPHQALAVLGANYLAVLANPDALRCQLQGHAASADPEIRRHMREGFIEVFDLVQRLTGADRAAVTAFMATGTLLNVSAVLELPDEYTVVA
jgi:AcrR family transcriptional regulator